MSQTMIEAKGFNGHDGTAFSMLRLGGIKTGLITKRISDTVALRAGELKIDHIHQGIQDKLTCFEGILKKYILKAQGKWKRVVREYIRERSPKKTARCWWRMAYSS